MIVVYKVSPLSYAILKRLITVKQIALANIVAGRPVVPELIQSAATADRIAMEAARLLTDTAYHQRMRRDLGRPLLERLVDLAAQLVADDEEDEDRCEHDGERDRRRGCDRDPGPEAHAHYASRSA
jgi:lipid A disaccharide synthetase